MEARSSSAPSLEDRRRLEVRRETPASCGLVEATEEDGDDALGTAALPPQPLPPRVNYFAKLIFCFPRPIAKCH